ncbi:Tetratricopeptide repeat protein [Pseudobythopirellula maris]|uniref:Tetratricopeptide repeat protein n=1 Tax=Pseudobythopirellula maris TaxID=2527991 RepID=A0A5C5ZMG7_9BACT|nr:tetratricopeptide repeat protein [Pseudobythopirellula maris]TWT88315.1 Tetratricopeptide repeat protein [Pseudobythopirellula maris]
MSDPSALYDEADKLKASGDLEGAAAKLTEALAADEDYSLAHAALAVVLQKRGMHEEAIAHARRVTEIEPNDPFSYTALSVTYQRAYAGTNDHSYIGLAEEAMDRSRQIEAGQ